MDCKIVWTDAARNDLREIVSYIAGDNPEAAGVSAWIFTKRLAYWLPFH